MSFQDLQNGGRPSSSSISRTSPSQAVAAGIFQINTAVAGFRRLVDGLGTAKDTPDHRQKLSALPSSSSFFSFCFFSGFEISSLIGCFFARHNSRQRILQLVKETSAKLKALSESDQAADANVFPSSFFAFSCLLYSLVLIFSLLFFSFCYPPHFFLPCFPSKFPKSSIGLTYIHM